MERREFIALLGMAATAMPAPARAAVKHAPDSMAGRLVGTWSFASSVTTRRDGSTFDRWGTKPQGVFMFDSAGNYAQIIVGSESRVFGAKTFCAFGTYTVEEGRKILITRIASCSTAKLTGTSQDRELVLLTADEMKYSNWLSASNARAEVLWKRIA